MIELKNCDSLQILENYRAGLVIADIPDGFGSDFYEKAFSLFNSQIDGTLVVLCDNYTVPFLKLLSYATRYFRFAYHGVFIHENNFSHVMGFIKTRQEIKKRIQCVFYSDEQKNHREEKPVSLMKEIVETFHIEGLVIDPFMGSGASGIACRDLGIDYLGIEIDEHLFTTAKNRIYEKSLNK